VTLALAGCADMMADEPLQQDVAQLRHDVNALMLAANRGRGESETLSQLDRRSKEQASESARQASALATRIDNMSAELSRLSARLDDVSQRVEHLGRQVQSAATPPPRPANLPPSVAPPAAAPRPPASGQSAVARSGESVTGPTEPSAEGATPQAAGGATPQESYQAAYLDFTKGRYTLAIPAFREFVRRFPDSAQADSAQYAIGESYFSLARASAASGQTDKSRQELEQAVQEFRKVMVNYPRGSKVPTALYKEALALTELKQTSLAQARLQYLLDHFPQSEEAPLAKERLAALKQ
jgi:TolA-binding protein